MLVRSFAPVLLYCDYGVCDAQQGYEMREAAWVVYARSFGSLAKFEDDISKAAMHATMLAVHDAIPVTSVGVSFSLQYMPLPDCPPCRQTFSVIHSVLCRCLDNPTLCMAGCFIQALHVPILDVEDLIAFFNEPEVRYLSQFYHFTLVMESPLPILEEERIDLGVGEGPSQDWADIVPDPPATPSSIALNATHSSPAPPATPSCPPPPEAVDLVAMCRGHEQRVKTLEARLSDCEQSLIRFGLLMDQSIGRLDDHLAQVIVTQKKDGRALHEIRGVIHALVAEVGKDAVDERLASLQQQHQHQQFQQRQKPPHQAFAPPAAAPIAAFYGKPPPRQTAEWGDREPHDHRDEPWKRQGRPGRRGRGHM